MHRTNVACLPEVSAFLKGLKEKSPRFCKKTTWIYTRVNQETQVGVEDKSGDFKDILCMEPKLPCYVMSSAPPGFLRILPPQPLGASGTKVPATQTPVSSRNFNEGSFSGARMITVMIQVKTEVQGSKSAIVTYWLCELSESRYLCHPSVSPSVQRE